ncbi:MAG: phosphatidate cytidylyltransferase [Elusimicrobiota bacterium]
MHKKRLFSAVAAIILSYLFVLWGGLAFFLLVFALALGALGEFYFMADNKKLPSQKIWGSIILVVFFLNAYFINYSYLKESAGDMRNFILFLAIAGVLMLIVFKSEIKETAVSSGITLLGVLYIGWLMLHAVFLRNMRPYGYHFTIIALGCTWIADSAAFYIGGKLGKKPLHPASPNKSRAGAVASVVFGAGGAVLIVYLLGLDFMTPAQIIILGVVIGAAAVMGDLCESALKRSFGMKDSGSFLPGHGGLLDRLDSLLFTVPTVYYFAGWYLL